MSAAVMSPLTGPQFEELSKALSDSFNRDSLQQLVMFKLDKEDYNEVNWDKPFNTVTFNLIQITEQKGKTEALITAAYLARSNNPQIKAFVERHFPHATTPMEPALQVKAVTAGLTALVSMLQRLADPGVQKIIGRYQADFEITMEKIQSLARYKTLHDKLHQLNFTYLSSMADAAGLWQQSEAQRQILERYALQLQGDAKRADEVAKSLRNYRVEKDWIDSLDQAAAMVLQALDSNQEAPLKRGLDSLRRVLKEEPARVNALLSEMAGDLRLSQLIQAMKTIQDSLAQLPQNAQDSQATQEFASGLRSLYLLQPRMAGLVEEHFEWQWLDKEFAAADALPGTVPEERFPRWESFKKRILRLCDLSLAKDWSISLSALLKELEEAGAGKDSVRFARRYNKFRTVAADRFFNVDAELNDVSDQLGDVASPLDQLLRIASHDKN